MSRLTEASALGLEIPTLQQLAQAIDHAELKPQTVPQQIVAACRMARSRCIASVCVQSGFAALAHECLTGTKVNVCCAIGFPHGAACSVIKACEADEVVRLGAKEVDMVIAVGRLLAGDNAYVLNDIRVVREAIGPNIILKVILENHYLDREQKVLACRLAEEAGANFVKTSTGFAPTGCTIDDVKLMRASVGPHMGVKAAGGLHSLMAALDALQAGATRLGVSATEKILDDFEVLLGATERPRDILPL
jgi:deoxyribose-phosphate aldolase